MDDGLKNLEVLAKWDRTTLRSFATLALLADALGSWGQGTRVFVSLLLGPKTGVGIDEAMLRSVCKKLPNAGRRLLIRIPQLADLTPKTFIRVLRAIQTAMYSDNRAISAKDVESFSYMCFLFIQRHPSYFQKLNPRDFRVIAGARLRGDVERIAYTLCVRIILGINQEHHIKQILSRRPSQRISDLLVDTLRIKFEGRDSIRAIIKQHRNCGD